MAAVWMQIDWYGRWTRFAAVCAVMLLGSCTQQSEVTHPSDSGGLVPMSSNEEDTRLCTRPGSKTKRKEGRAVRRVRYDCGSASRLNQRCSTYTERTTTRTVPVSTIQRFRCRNDFSCNACERELDALLASARRGRATR